jgi:hypothetical protein
MNEPEIYLPLGKPSLSFRWRGTNYEVFMDSHFLTITTRNGPFSTTSKTPLSNLLDDFVVDAPLSPSARYHGGRFIFPLIAALIVQFSAVPRFVPALAPVLFAYALFHIVCFLRHVMPMQQTRVLNYYGAAILAIPHLPELEVSRRRFEDQLRDAVKKAKSFPHDQLRVAVEKSKSTALEDDDG